MTCESCSHLKNTQPGAPIRATMMYPCTAPFPGLPRRADYVAPASCRGRDGMRRQVFVGFGAGCPVYVERSAS